MSDKTGGNISDLRPSATSLHGTEATGTRRRGYRLPVQRRRTCLSGTGDGSDECARYNWGCNCVSVYGRLGLAAAWILGPFAASDHSGVTVFASGGFCDVL